MAISITTDIHSLGLEPKECLGFESEEELEIALAALTKEAIKQE